MSERRASVRRDSRETQISASWDLDTPGDGVIATGIGMLDHLIDQLGRHGRFTIEIQATGDLHIDAHHTAEDCAMVLGRALDQALGDRRGIVRMAHAIVPLDESLAQVVVDLGGRGYSVIDAPFQGEMMGQLPTELIHHFLETLAREARMNLHVNLLAGRIDHHRAEAIFKALARALDQATRIDPRIAGVVPSTKGILDGAG